METRGAPGWSSLAEKPRPNDGDTPKTRANCDVTRTPVTTSGESPRVSVNDTPDTTPATASNARGISRQLESSRFDAVGSGAPSRAGCRLTTRSGSRNGSGRSTTALTTLNTAAVAPIPSASVVIAAIANDGDLIS